jgi:hypothetical protein
LTLDEVLKTDYLRPCHEKPPLARNKLPNVPKKEAHRVSMTDDCSNVSVTEAANRNGLAADTETLSRREAVATLAVPGY